MRAQSGPKWSTSGNSVVSGDHLGTTNNFPLLFKVNNALKMTLNTNGTLQLNNFSGSGTGLVKYDNNGALVQLPFTNSSNDVLFGDGTFGPINFSQSGWTSNGYDLYYNGTGNVGIGNNSPSYKLDVTGNIRVTGTVFTSGVLISNQVQAGTASLGAVDATSTVVSGTSTVAGNLGIGTINPSAKLDVFGNANVSGAISASTLNISGVSNFTNKIQTPKITGLPGDTVLTSGFLQAKCSHFIVLCCELLLHHQRSQLYHYSPNFHIHK